MYKESYQWLRKVNPGLEAGENGLQKCLATQTNIKCMGVVQDTFSILFPKTTLVLAVGEPFLCEHSESRIYID